MRLKPNDASALLGIGLANSQLGQIEMAIRYYQQAIEIEPGNATIGRAGV